MGLYSIRCNVGLLTACTNGDVDTESEEEKALVGLDKSFVDKTEEEGWTCVIPLLGPNAVYAGSLRKVSKRLRLARGVS